MADFTDEIKFDGGLNFDDDERIVPQGDYIDAFSMLNGARESGSIMNMPGNTIQSYTLPSGRNVVIGAERDIKRNAIIYFVWNENEDHSILHYFCETKTIEEIFAPKAALPVTGIPFTTEFLQFTEFAKIHSANILDDILLWTDGNVHPRKINIKRAKDFMLQLTPSVTNTPYDNLIATGVLANKLQFINSIKYAPLVPADIELGQDDTKQTNFIRNKMLQVIYRWVYDDNEKSRWNTGSYVSLPVGQENINGIITNGVQNNYLAVTYNTGHPTVKNIDIAFRFNNLDVWRRLDEPIKKYDEDNVRIAGYDDFTDLVFNFYNDRVLIPVDVADTDINFDAIPLKSATQEIIDSNRLLYANNTEGYENPELDVSTLFGNILVPVNVTDDTTILLTSNGLPVVPTNGNAICFPFTPVPISIGDVISVNFQYPPTGFNGDINYVVTSHDVDTYPYGLAANLLVYIDRIACAGVVTGTSATINISGAPYMWIIYPFASAPLFNAPKIIQPTTEVTSFKKGAFHKLGLVYSDYGNRDGGVVTNPDFVQYIKTFPEMYPLGAEPLDDDNAWQSYIDVTINHVPPIWAEKYQIVRAKNNLRKYIQFPLKVRAVTTPQGNIELDLTYMMNYRLNKTVNGSMDFQFENGDRVRFIANADYYCPQYVEVPVLAFNSTNNILTVGYFDWADVYGNMSVTTSEGMLVEYFAYANEADEANQFYFETGEVYDIVAAGTATRRHAGNLQNQNAAHTIPAQVRLTRGDTYQYRRYTDLSALERIVESENFSDYYASSNFDISRVQGVRNEKTKQHGQQLRYGGRYFADTLTNNLLSFDGANFDTLLTTYGPICKVLMVGYTLKCLQTKKLTSIYINRQQTFNANGSPQLILTDEVLGNKDPSTLDYGCIHPESVCQDQRYMYFYDINSGAFIQDSANGPFPISTYKANTYFKNKSNEIRNSANNDKIFVYVAADNYNGTVNITFSDENTTSEFTNDTIIYRTDNNRWISREPYICEYVVSNGLVLVSFKDGALYLHNDKDQLRGNFYGVQYEPYVTFVSNNDPEIVKTYDNLAINSNKLWYSPNDTDITIPANGNYLTGMASRLLATKFRAKEGVWYSDYMRDLNTPNVTNPIVSGRRLKGNYLIHRVTTDATDEALLFSILIKSTYSPMSG